MIEWVIIAGIVIYALRQQPASMLTGPSAETPSSALDPSVGDLLNTVPNPVTAVPRAWRQPTATGTRVWVGRGSPTGTRRGTFRL